MLTLPAEAERPLNARETLRQAIDDEQRRLREGIPPDRQAALIALLHALDQLPADSPTPDVITGRHPHDLGGKLALCLCLEAARAKTTVGEPVSEGWAKRFLCDCGQIVRAESILLYVESGDLTLVADESSVLHAWFISKRPPPPLHERRDIDWWARWLAASRVTAMDLQFPYPPEAVVGGAAVQAYIDVLRWLIARATAARERDAGPACETRSGLVEAVSAELGIAPQIAARALDGFTLDRENAPYHAAVTGGGSAPLIAVSPGHLALSLHGLTTEPLFFLARELRRRDPQTYHNSAFLREERFRADLYALFPDNRFVTSAGRIRVRREQGDLRTDIDAAIFDRKTGALGIFELKSHDPFARTSAELARQRDNVLYANRQVSGVLDWLKRHGADDLLSRIDQPTAKRHRVSKVFPFVLGRYLVRFNGGQAPDRRAAWATWPQVLRAMEEPPPLAHTSSPIATLHARLRKDDPDSSLLAGRAAEEIVLGARRLIVHPSYAAYKAHLP